MRVMLIGPSFFGYCEMVAAEMKRQGHEVTLVSDRPSDSVAFKSLAKISYSLVSASISKYAAMVEGRLLADEYDMVLFMSGMSFCFTRNQFARIKQASSAKFVLYLWDSLSNCQRVGSCLDLFDKAFSFEPDDCNRYGLGLLPLFYDGAYSHSSVDDEEIEYDACFVGSVHQVSKFNNVRQIANSLKRDGYKVFTYFYMPSRSVAKLRTFFHPEYKEEQLRFEPLSKEEVSSLYSKSRAIIDSPQTGQNGLTMRTMETLGAKRKLITANCSISSYEFFDERNIYIAVEGCSPTKDFFESGYVSLDDAIYEKYSISGFVRRLINLEV